MEPSRVHSAFRDLTWTRISLCRVTFLSKLIYISFTHVKLACIIIFTFELEQLALQNVLPNEYFSMYYDKNIIYQPMVAM